MIKTIKDYIRRKKEFVSLNRINFKVRTYTPKVNKVRLWSLFSFIGLCLFTPMTNWLIPLPFKLISKFSPLWVYK